MRNSFKNRFVSKIDSNYEQILSLDFYQHKTIMQAIQSPFKALESGNFNDGLTSVLLSAYLLEKFAQANGTLDPENKDYIDFLKKEKEKSKKENLEETELIFKVRIAYAKISYILREIESEKPTSTDYKV